MWALQLNRQLLQICEATTINSSCSQCGCSKAPPTGWPKCHRASNESRSPHWSAAVVSTPAAVLFILRVGPITVGGSFSSAPPPTSLHPHLLHLCFVCTQTQRDAACNHRRTQFQGQFQGYLLSRVNIERKKHKEGKKKRAGGEIKKDFHKKWKPKKKNHF